MGADAELAPALLEGPAERLPREGMRRELGPVDRRPPQPGPGYPTEVGPAGQDWLHLQPLGYHVGVGLLHDDILPEGHDGELVELLDEVVVEVQGDGEEAAAIAVVAPACGDPGEVLAGRRRRPEHYGLRLRRTARATSPAESLMMSPLCWSQGMCFVERSTQTGSVSHAIANRGSPNSFDTSQGAAPTPSNAERMMIPLPGGRRCDSLIFLCGGSGT